MRPLESNKDALSLSTDEYGPFTPNLAHHQQHFYEECKKRRALFGQLQYILDGKKLIVNFEFPEEIKFSSPLFP